MSFFNNLIWGAVGYALGGPIGAIIAAVASNALSGQEKRLAPGREHPKQQEDQLVFSVTTFSLLAKLAKADGVVSKEEVQVIDRFIKQGLQLDDQQRDIAIEIFNTAKDSSHSFEGFAKQYHQILGHSPAMMREMLRLLYGIAAADGVFHPREKELIAAAARIFNIPDYEHEHIRKSFFPSTEGYYATLESKPSDSMETIKKRYRKLVTDNHPDKIVAQGLPEEFVQLATEKLQKINAAYEAIQKERGTN